MPSDAQSPTKPPRSAARLVGYATTLTLLLIVLRASNSDFTSLNIGTLDAAKFASSLTFFFVLALIFERAVEVVLATVCGPAEVHAHKTSRALEIKADTLAEREKQNLSNLENPAERLEYLSNTAVSDLKSSASEIAVAKGETANKLADIKALKSRLSGLFLLLLGGAASLSGLLILTHLLAAAGVTIPDGTQASQFKVLDVLVTTLVLGGGANGIHIIMKRILADA